MPSSARFAPLPLLACAVLAFGPPAAVRADVLIGSYGSGSSTESLRGFADAYNGNAAPMRNLAGTATTLHAPVGGAYEPVEDVVYVADFWGQAIRVFAVGANGNAAPKRVLDSPYVGQARAVAIDVTHDELLTFTSGCCLAAFNRTDSGSAFLKRSVQWGGLAGSVTELNYPQGLVYLAPTDEVALIDSDAASPYTPKVLVFDRAASGNTAPRRILRGASTLLGSYVSAIAYDVAARELYVAAYQQNADQSRSGRILVFDDTANGNAPPKRKISGFFTGLELTASGRISGLAIDPQRHMLVVAIDDYNTPANDSLLMYPLGAAGNTSPSQVIAGTQTGFANLGAPIWVPDRILRSGFD